MQAAPRKLPPISSALADYLARNPEAAARLAGMPPESAAAALARLQRWIDQTRPARPAP